MPAVHYVAALEFFDKGHNGLFVAVGRAHLAHGLKHGPIRAIFLVFAQIFVSQLYASTREPEGVVNDRLWPKAALHLTRFQTVRMSALGERGHSRFSPERQKGGVPRVRPLFLLAEALPRIRKLLLGIFHAADITVSVAIPGTNRLIDSWAVSLAL